MSDARVPAVADSFKRPDLAEALSAALAVGAALKAVHGH